MSDLYVSPTLRKYLIILDKSSYQFKEDVKAIRKRNDIKVDRLVTAPFFKVISAKGESSNTLEADLSQLMEDFFFPSVKDIRTILMNYIILGKLPLAPYQTCINTVGTEDNPYTFKAKGPGIIINLLGKPTRAELFQILNDALDNEARLQLLKIKNLHKKVKAGGPDFLDNEIKEIQKTNPFLVEFNKKGAKPHAIHLIDVYIFVYRQMKVEKKNVDQILAIINDDRCASKGLKFLHKVERIFSEPDIRRVSKDISSLYNDLASEYTA